VAFTLRVGEAAFVAFAKNKMVDPVARVNGESAKVYALVVPAVVGAMCELLTAAVPVRVVMSELAPEAAALRAVLAAAAEVAPVPP
jgi:hypothetical protein